MPSKTYLYEPDRKKLRQLSLEKIAEGKREIQVSALLQCEINSATVMIRLLDTIDDFVGANHVLSGQLSEAQNDLDVEAEKNGELCAKNTALQEYATKVEGERDAMKQALDINKLENTDFDGELNELEALAAENIFDDVFERLDEIDSRVAKLEARASKKAVKKSTSTKVKK